MKTEQEVRKEFAAYFLDLKTSMEKEGGKVCKVAEWKFFVQHKVDEGSLPAEALVWKCPKSLGSELGKQPRKSKTEGKDHA